MRNRKKIIESIILIYPLLYGLQDKIEREQEIVIADMTSPAERVVERLIALDNRRIDLCNLKVLYGFIERGLGEKFGILRSCVFAGVDCGLYKLAAAQLELCGYDTERCESEFSYLFKLLKKSGKRKKSVQACAEDLVGAASGV